jgi:hypothetical protein
MIPLIHQGARSIKLRPPKWCNVFSMGCCAAYATYKRVNIFTKCMDRDDHYWLATAQDASAGPASRRDVRDFKTASPESLLSGREDGRADVRKRNGSKTVGRG